MDHCPSIMALEAEPAPPDRSEPVAPDRSWGSAPTVSNTASRTVLMKNSHGLGKGIAAAGPGRKPTPAASSDELALESPVGVRGRRAGCSLGTAVPWGWRQ